LPALFSSKNFRAVHYKGTPSIWGYAPRPATPLVRGKNSFLPAAPLAEIMP
jgi:hypothetical protein